MLDVLSALIDANREGRPVVHCQVVETRGSTPQKAGARMLLFEDGGQLGTLGGGCVEAEVKQKAMRHFGDPAPALHTFVLDHDYAWADGLICGGKMTILSEGGHGQGEHLGHVLARLQRREGITEMIAIDPSRSGLPLGARRVVSEAAGARASGWPESIPAPEPLRSRPRPSVRQGVAYLPHPAAPSLVVIGAGHVGQAVADLAAGVGFEVIVADDRPLYASRERFPRAAAIVTGPFERVWDDLRSQYVNENTYVLVVTRGHGHDQEALAQMAPTDAAYVGLIGSRRKIKMIFDALRESGVADDVLARVAAPVGIDIGSESVEEIAISIVAELIAFRNRGTPPSSIASRATWR